MHALIHPKLWAKQNWIFLATAVAGLIAYLLISIVKHVHFGSTGYDLTIFDQAIRHYSEFKAPASSLRGYDNLLGDHFHPILILLAPLYWVFSSPVNLLVAQAVLIASASLPVYLYAKSKLGKTPAIIISAVFILSPVLLRALYFDFHEIAFAIPLIAWAIYFIDRSRFGWMYVSLGLLLLVKEDLSLLVATFGIYLLLQRQFRHGFIIIVSGVVWFLLATKLFIPYFAGVHGAFSYWTYTELGPDLFSAGLNILKHPLLFTSLLIFPIVKLVTVVKTFSVFVGFTFLSPIVILTIPLLLERLLSTSENYWQFNYHYGAVLAPIMVMAAVDGLHRLVSWKWFKGHSKKITIIISGTFLLISIVFFIISPMVFILKPSSYPLTQTQQSGYEIIALIPPSASVCTTNHIAPHLGAHNLTLIGFGGSTQHILSCEYIVTSSKLDTSTQLDSTIEGATDNYHIQSQKDGWILYKKGNSR